MYLNNTWESKVKPKKQQPQSHIGISRLSYGVTKIPNDTLLQRTQWRFFNHTYGETIVVIERRNAHGIQSAHGWSRFPKGMKALWSMGVQGESEVSHWPWGIWGQLGGSPKWWWNGHTFPGALRLDADDAPQKRLPENFASQYLKPSAPERDATGERKCLPCQDSVGLENGTFCSTTHILQSS